MKLRVRGVFSPKVLISLVAAGAVGLGAVGLISLMARRGEAAIGMIPADAIVAISFDNTPSASQAALFNEIKNAMEDSGLNSLVDDMLEGAADGSPVLKKLRGYLKGSFAMALWGDMSEGEPEGMIAVTLNNTRSAEELVSSLISVRFDGDTRYYELDTKGIVTFKGDYAVVASSLDVIRKVVSVADGKAPSLYEQASFKEARASLPSDASLMVFMNGAALADADADMRSFFGSMGLQPEGWTAYSFTLRSEGVQIDAFSPGYGEGDYQDLLLAMKPLNYASLERFPEGAVGVVGLSNFAAMLEIYRKMFGEMEEIAAEVEDGIAEMESEFGLTLEGDILPALRGEMFLAVYPPAPGEDDPRILFSIDSQNGGTPGNLLELIAQKANSGQFDDEHKTHRMAVEQLGDMKLFVPSDSSDGVLFAKTDDQVMLFTSRTLLRIVAGDSDRSLMESEPFTTIANEPAQMKIHMDMYALADMIDELAGPEFDLRQILTQRELSGTYTYDGKAGTMRMLVPVNVPELIRLTGKQAKSR